MQSFATFRSLQEASSSQSFDAIKAAIALFPVDSRRQEKQSRAIALGMAAIESNSIYGPELTEFKETISRALEAAYEKACDEELYQKARAITDDAARRKFFDDLEAPSMFAVQSVKKLLAHFQKHAVAMPKSLKVIQGLAEYKELMDKFKAVLVKGKRPAPVDPGKIKKVADYQIQKQVMAYLQEAADGVRQQLYRSNLEFAKKNLARIKAAGITDKKGYVAFLKNNPALQLIAQQAFFVERDRYNTNPGYHIREDRELDEIAAKEASLITDQIIGQFVAKNTSKLSLIVQRKKSIKAHKILTNQVRNGVLENEMFFEFDDSSSFKIYSKVEYAYSPKGTLFMRMPTRFTNVTMADGSKMKGAASEERMVTDF